MKWLNRKDIARITGLSVRQVRSNAKRWGIDQFEVKVNKRTVLYRRDETITCLKAAGLA